MPRLSRLEDQLSLDALLDMQLGACDGHCARPDPRWERPDFVARAQLEAEQRQDELRFGGCRQYAGGRIGVMLCDRLSWSPGCPGHRPPVGDMRQEPGYDTVFGIAHLERRLADRRRDEVQTMLQRAIARLKLV